MSRFLAPPAAILVCAIAAFAQTAPEDDPKLGRVTGTVAEAKTGDAVRKALVMLRRESGLAAGTLTDGSGKFALRNLEPGVYMVSVEKDGWVAARDSRRLTATVAAGQTDAALTLKLLRTSAVSGRVLDADGDPLAGGSIQLAAEPPRKGGAPGSWASTNDRGEYRAYNVAPGQYRICCADPAAARRARGLRSITPLRGRLPAATAILAETL